MATTNQPANEDEEQNQPGGVATGGAGGVSEAGSPAGAGSSPVKQDAAAQNQSGYTDVGAYLNANKAGAEKMGGQVAQNLTNRYDQTKAGVTQSANDLINQVNQGYTKENSGLVKSVAADPYAAANNPDQLSQFQAQLNSSYGGPTEWGDYGTQLGKVNEATQYGNLYKTKGGANVLAQELEGPLASQGVNQLDSLLLRGSPEAATAIKSASDPFNALSSFLDQQKAGATEAIAGGKQAAQTTAQSALNAFTGQGGALTNLNASVQQKAADALARAQEQSALAASGATDLSDERMTQDEWKALGLTDEQAGTLMNALIEGNKGQYMTGRNFGAEAAGLGITDLSGYLSQQDPTAAINPGTVASQEDYAKMAAIQQLLGGKMPQDMALNPQMANLAGTAPASFNAFDYEAALNDILNATAANRQSAQGEANRLTAEADAKHAASKKKGISGKLRQAIPAAARYVVNPALTVPTQIRETRKQV